MGRSAGAKKTNQLIEDQYNKQNAQKNALMAKYGTYFDESKKRSDELLNKALGGYEGVLNDTGVSDKYNAIYDTGGFDPSDLEGINRDIGSLEEYAKGGSVSEADRARIRGGGVYDEASKTGLWSDPEKADFRARAGSVLPAFYDAVKNEFSRQNTAQGGYNPGYTYQNAKLARDASRQSAAANLEAETTLADSIRKNRQWGAEGMTSSEMALQGLLDNIFRGSTTAALSARTGIADSKAKNRLAATSGLSQVNQDKLNAAQGIGSLRAQTPGTDAMYASLYQRAIESGDEETLKVLQLMSQRNPNSGFWDKFFQLVNAGVSAASAYAKLFPGDVTTGQDTLKHETGAPNYDDAVPF